MPRPSTARISRLMFCLFLAGLTLPSSGCLAAAVTAGVVGAGAAGYAYYQGASPRDCPVTLDQAWSATQLALGDLGMPIVSGQRDHGDASIEARTGDGDKVTITLSPKPSRVPADGIATTISVRVGTFGDGPVSERILNQIDSRLGVTRQPVQPAPAPVNSTPPAAGQLTPMAAPPPGYQTGPPPLAHGQ